MEQSHKTQPESRPTPTIEDYLAIIYVMERDGDEVVAARLAESLEVAPPTVTVTLKRMDRDGWIATDQRKKIRLTDKGCAAASSVIRRHMLTEWMLARMLKVPWSRVHAEADQIEHAISDEMEIQMRTNLNDPQFCPHGNPLPGYEHVAAGWFPLNGVLPGEKVIIRRIHETAEDNNELMEFLEKNDIVPGALAEVTEILPFNQTLSLQLGEQKVALGFPTAKYIFVEKVA
ncbi:MAG TPA: metal-dependent transcriptional regulator [Anaerolineaceae bacterium]|nr:metal-dependent transcriptional regulator [Anaerolineaceae bacterium]